MDHTNSNLSPGTLTTHAKGLPVGVWVAGALMGVTIVGLAAALAFKGHGTTAEATPVPLAAASTAAIASGSSAPLDIAPAAGPNADGGTANTVAAAQPAVVPAPVPVPVHSTHRMRPEDTPAATGGGSSVADESAREPARSRVASASACETCGVIESYSTVQVQGQVNGVGAVAGGVGGALIGSQIAGRHNHTLGGVLGAVGGGLLGNQIEKHERMTTVYDVHVRMNDGSIRTVRQSHAPQVGERVWVEGHSLRARPAQG